MDSDILEKIRGETIKLKDKIENMSFEDKENFINEQYKKWTYGVKNDIEHVKNDIEHVKNDIDYVNKDTLYFLNLALKNFNSELNYENLKFSIFDVYAKRLKMELCYIRQYINDDKVEDLELIKKINKISKAIIDAEYAITFAIYLKETFCEKEINKSKEDNNILRFTPFNYENNSDFQDLILFLLFIIKERKFKRCNGSCYERNFINDIYDSHSMREVCTIGYFIRDEASQLKNSVMWQKSTKPPSNIDSAEKYLESCLEFEDLKKDRHVFSFKNGIYITRNTDTKIGNYSDLWLPYENCNLSSDIIASKYFDINFEYYEDEDDWFEIIESHCPVLKKILDHQEFPKEVQKWLCILFGRMLYYVGELDDWQIFGFLLGQGGTGKSTIINNIVGEFYESTDVACISNSIEKTFGLYPLKDKFILISPEVTGDFGLAQTDFQSMVSGERIEIKIKYEHSVNIKWLSPIMLGGNSTFGYINNSGSVTRRTLILNFEKIVSDEKNDPTFRDRIKTEIPYIIQAGNKGYLETLNKYGKKGIWDIVPEYFKISKKELAENTNTLENFLGSGDVKFGKDFYVPKDVFWKFYDLYCRTNKIGKAIPYKKNDVSGPFQNHKIETLRNHSYEYNGQTIRGIFFKGVDINENNMINKDRF